MESKLVSVIMPAYNGERFISQAIESMLVQTYSGWELIVVDDGSTDATARIVRSYKDPRIVYIHQDNCGQTASLNHGLNLARGEYITTLDVDDWFTPESLFSRVEFFEGNSQYDVVYGDGLYCDTDGKPLRRFSELRTGEVIGDVFDILISNAFFATGANVMIRSSILKQYAIRYDETLVWCQDYDLYVRLAEKCSFGYVDTITVWYRLHDTNMTVLMPKGRRRDSIARAKFKILDSQRFAMVQDSYKFSFFHDFLLYDLDLRTDDQTSITNHPNFITLPKKVQANLVRLLASGYLLVSKDIPQVRIWLAKSWRLNPFDPKTVILLFLAYFKTGPFELLFTLLQRIKLRTKSYSSPFDEVKK
jgi:glycosyltransferase involved in cell wall biosynthesis